MSALLRGLRLAVIDCETTGLPPGAHVVEVAVVHLTIERDARPVVALSSRVRPPIPIPPEATRKHGITDADVADAPTWAEILPRVREAIDGRVVTAFHAPADFAFTTDEQDRLGEGPIAPWPWLDLHVIARDSNKYEHNLSAVATRQGIALDAHGAAGDAVATALLARPLLSSWRARNRYGTGPALPPTLADLLGWQRDAALSQEAEFVAYLRSRGARGRRPDSPWHDLEGIEPPPWPDPPPPTWRIEKDGRVVPVEEAA